MNAQGYKIKLEEQGVASTLVCRSNQEFVDALIALQRGIAFIVCGEDRAECVRCNDIVESVRATAAECGLAQSPLLEHFESLMRNLGSNIAKSIQGVCGENWAKRAVRLLKYDRDTFVLPNVFLREDEGVAEIDLLILTPYGVFVIEVKNDKADMIITRDGCYQKRNNPSFVYPLAERMVQKELLVRETIGTDIDVPIHTMLLFVNDRSNLDDLFQQIEVAKSSNVVLAIRSHAKDGYRLSSEQVRQIKARFESQKVEPECGFDFGFDYEAVIDGFAELMEAIDTASSPEPVQAAANVTVKKAPQSAVIGNAVGRASKPVMATKRTAHPIQDSRKQKLRVVVVQKPRLTECLAMSVASLAAVLTMRIVKVTH